MSTNNASSRTETLRKVLEWKTTHAGYQKNESVATSSFMTAAKGGAIAATEKGCCLSPDLSFFYSYGEFSRAVSPLVIYDSTGAESPVSVSTNNANRAVYITKYTTSGTPVWATKVDSTDGTIKYGWATITSDGSIIVTGLADKQIEFYNVGDTSPSKIITASTPPLISVWLAKYNSDGILQWAFRNATFQLAFNLLPSISMKSDKILLTYHQQQPGLLLITDIHGVASSINMQDRFNQLAVTYNLNGEYVLATHIGCSAEMFGTTIFNNKDVIVVGGVVSLVNLNIYDLNNIHITTLPLNNFDSFIIKYKENGAILWCTRITGASFKLITGANSVTDDNIYIYGRFASALTTISFYDSINLLYPAKIVAGSGTVSVDSFLAKFDTYGYVQWVSVIGGVGNEDSDNIVIDADSNIIACGYTEGSQLLIYDASPSMNPLPPPAMIRSFPSTRNYYLIKFNSDGKSIWNTYIGNIGTIVPPMVVSPLIILSNDTTNIYAIGAYNNNTVTFYNPDLIEQQTLTNPGSSQNTFLAKYDTNGNPVWISQTISNYNATLTNVHTI
jgi:hypothetical protein